MRPSTLRIMLNTTALEPKLLEKIKLSGERYRKDDLSLPLLVSLAIVNVSTRNDLRIILSFELGEKKYEGYKSTTITTKAFKKYEG